MFKSIIPNPTKMKIDKSKVVIHKNGNTYLSVLCPECTQHFIHILNDSDHNPTIFVCAHCYKGLSVSRI